MYLNVSIIVCVLYLSIIFLFCPNMQFLYSLVKVCFVKRSYKLLVVLEVIRRRRRRRRRRGKGRDVVLVVTGHWKRSISRSLVND